MNRLHRLSALLAVVVLSSCATGPDGDSSFNYRLLDDRESGLAYAMRFAAELHDPGVRAGSYVDIAGRYEALGLTVEANAIRDFAAQAILTSPEGAAVSEAALRLARYYLAEGNTARVNRLLDTAVARVGGLPSTAAQARLLEEVINLCFAAGDELFDVLRRAIEAVFVIEDLGRRVEILSTAAVRYQAQGVRQSANVLIQQAIPAAGNIAEPWMRASAFASIARAYRAIGEDERALGMIEDAVALVRGEAGIPAEAAATFLGKLVELDLRPRALDLAEGIDRSASRAAVLSRIAEKYGSEEQQRSSAFVLYARAASAAGSVEDPMLRAASFVTVGESYLRFGENQLATIQASNAVRSLARVDSARRDTELLRRLVDLLIAADAPQQLATVSDLAGTPPQTMRICSYVAVSAYAAYETVALEHLDRAQAARAEVSEEDEAPIGEIAFAAARLGRINAAISELPALDEAEHITEVMIAVGYSAMENGGLTDEQRSRIEEFYRTYRQRQRLG
jgi:tetratricopeptide (TPR) repeat protein